MEGHQGRNIVLCFDGTGDWFGTGYTNVAKIYQNLDRDAQLSFYDGGVGTLTSPQALSKWRRIFLKLLDLASATGLREKALNGYTFLVRNYQEGDRIFLFGFSRGAYTARVVAAMIHRFGLLRTELDHLAPYLWQTIAAHGEGEALDEASLRIKRYFARRPRKIGIHFMGLFDTVSSVGVIGRFQVHPNTDKNDSVARTCHAVSIDEQRNVFPEALMHPGQPGLTEVWFPGVHRDAGGGLELGRSRIADESLRWIEGEAVKSGLLVTQHTPEGADPATNYPPFDPYIVAGLYPMNIFNKTVSEYRTLWPKWRHIRVIPEFSLIHSIAFQLKKHDPQYDPVNWPKNAVPFNTGDESKGPEHYVLPPAKWTPEDVFGIVLGTALLFLIWNRLAAYPLGHAEPPHRLWGWPFWTWTWLLTGVFLACLALGQKFVDRQPRWLRLRPEGVLGKVAGLAGLGLGLAFWDWPLLQLGLVGGAVFAIIAQLPVLPALCADRVLASVLGAVLGSFALAWGLVGLHWVLGFLWRIEIDWTAAWPWLLPGLLAILALRSAIYIVLDRFRMRPIEEEALKTGDQYGGL